MAKIVLSADTGVITRDDVIEIIPLTIMDADTGAQYQDQTQISVEEVFGLRGQGHRITTSCMNIHEAKVFFENLLQQHEHIVHLSMSSKVSRGSYETSRIAAQELAPDRITVIDTKTGSSGGLLVAQKARKALQASPTVKELTDYITKSLVSRSKTAIVVPDPSGYKRSGKGMINGIVNLALGALSSARGLPLVKLNESGAMLPYKLLRYSNMDQLYVDLFHSQYIAEEAADNEIAVSYLMPQMSRVDALTALLAERGLCTYIGQMSGVIGSYACQDTVGISYLLK
jgi:Uncharacterized protein conserved in bacteria